MKKANKTARMRAICPSIVNGPDRRERHFALVDRNRHEPAPYATDRMKPPSQVGNGGNYPSIDSPNRAWCQLDSSWRSAQDAGRTQNVRSDLPAASAGQSIPKPREYNIDVLPP